MKTSKQPKPRKLSSKFLKALVILAVVICVLTSATVTLLYYHSRMAEYSKTAFSLARMAADYIDGDRVQGYLDTGVTDDYYQEVQQFLDVVKQESDIWYYYVFVHDGDELIYVWDAHTDDEQNYLGDREAYIENGRCRSVQIQGAGLPGSAPAGSRRAPP